MFGLFKKSKGAAEPPRDVASLTSILTLPALKISRTRRKSPSYFLGLPSLPSGIQWPEYDEGPLSFLACLDLEQLQGRLPSEWLPAEGRLLFFYDVRAQPWGFDPRESGQWRVLYVQKGAPVRSEGGPPQGLKVARKQSMKFSPFRSYPAPCRAPPELELSGSEQEELTRLHEAPFGRNCRHQVGGHPSPKIASDADMEMECQLASHGVYCGDHGYLRDPRTPRLEKGAREWRLLLQIDEDSVLGLSWAGDGSLYFWVKESEARQGDFSNAWVILQRR